MAELVQRLVLCLGAVGLFAPAMAQQTKPLLFEDTKSIFQRVLTTPGQYLYDKPDGESVSPLWPLQPVYVYDRQDGWIQVGRETNAAEGWIEESSSAPWIHNIVGAFTQRGNDRERQLIFSDETQMQALLDDEAYLDLAAEYREAAARGQQTPESGVISIEPEDYVEIKNEFYLMPITKFKEKKVGPRRRSLDALYLEVAAVPLNNKVSGRVDKKFRTAVVFVIDTTRSMKPFIPETLETVEQIVADLRSDKDEDAMSFGLFGFRDNPDGRPGTEYRVREFVPLDAEAPKDAILDSLANMKAMEQGTSTWGFPEDSLAGVHRALDKSAWQTEKADFAARIIILITDAPGKEPDDPNAESDHTPSSIRKFADEKGVSISTLHLISRSGRDYNEIAKEQYTELSGFKDVKGTYYFPVEATDKDTFRKRLRAVTTKLVGSITDDPDKFQNEDEEVDFSNLGPAMRLAFLGRQKGTTVPPILRGWTMNRSIEQFRRQAIEPMVMMTRNDLLSMSEIMSGIVDKADEAARSGNQSLFFEDVRNVVTAVSADSARVANEDADTLGGLIGEFLEYLPFVTKRRLMQMTETKWANDPGMRIEVKHELEGLLELYQSVLSTPKFWTELYEGQESGENVFAMPLSSLP